MVNQPNIKGYNTLAIEYKNKVKGAAIVGGAGAIGNQNEVNASGSFALGHF